MKKVAEQIKFRCSGRDHKYRYNRVEKVLKQIHSTLFDKKNAKYSLSPNFIFLKWDEMNNFPINTSYRILHSKIISVLSTFKTG